MALSQANRMGQSLCSTRLLRRCFVASAIVALMAVFALAQTEQVVTVMLPSYATTTDPDAQAKHYLTVAAAGAKDFKKAESWLFFDASSVYQPDVTSLQLQLVPREGAERGMAITVVAMAIAPRSGGQPVSYSLPENQKQFTLVSASLPKDPDLRKLRSDTVNLTGIKPNSLGLLLLPQPNASRRVYYGLNTRDPGESEDHPERLPRLIVTYKRASPSFTDGSSEPSRLSLLQSDGRLADSSPSRAAFGDQAGVLKQVAANSLTSKPVVYRNHLFVVHQVNSQFQLQELNSSGDTVASTGLLFKVRSGSPMVVDRFGMLTILTNEAILSADLDTRPQAKDGPMLRRVRQSPFAFNQVPKTVVPGPDQTLYMVKDSIFALNPFVGKNQYGTGQATEPEKIWDVAIQNPETAKITLSPDGRFLYALAKFTGDKSRFIAINAQTGKSVQLLPGIVKTTRKNVSWVSGMKFDGTRVGQTIPIGDLSCTVATTSSTSLTCKEDMGTHERISWADFPDNLNSFRNPVVVTWKGVDYISIAGNSGTGATLWGIRNDPVTQNGDTLARFTGVWKYPLEKGSKVGQPILNPIVLRVDEPGLYRNKKLYFLKSVTGDKTRLVAASVWDGTRLGGDGNGLRQGLSTEGDPVVDSESHAILWADGILFMFSADAQTWKSKTITSSAPLQLLFGPFGSLYAAEPGKVSRVN